MAWTETGPAHRARFSQDPTIEYLQREHTKRDNLDRIIVERWLAKNNPRRNDSKASKKKPIDVSAPIWRRISQLRDRVNNPTSAGGMLYAQAKLQWYEIRYMS